MVPGSVKPLARIACTFEQYSVAGSQIAAKPCRKNLELCSLICAVQIKEGCCGSAMHARSLLGFGALALGDPVCFWVVLVVV